MKRLKATEHELENTQTKLAELCKRVDILEAPARKYFDIIYVYFV